jgi:hypothetical protein
VPARQPIRAKDVLLGESLGGAQMSGKRPGIASRSTLVEKGVLCYGPGWIWCVSQHCEHAEGARSTTTDLTLIRRINGDPICSTKPQIPRHSARSAGFPISPYGRKPDPIDSSSSIPPPSFGGWGAAARAGGISRRRKGPGKFLGTGFPKTSGMSAVRNTGGTTPQDTGEMSAGTIIL